jgi:hypothetical protein
MVLSRLGQPLHDVRQALDGGWSWQPFQRVDTKTHQPADEIELASPGRLSQVGHDGGVHPPQLSLSRSVEVGPAKVGCRPDDASEPFV